MKKSGLTKTLLFGVCAVGLSFITGMSTRAAAAPVLKVGGECIYDGTEFEEYNRQQLEKLPAGMTFDSDTYTLTLNNVNQTISGDTTYIDGLSSGGDKTYDLHIRLIGNNTLRCNEAVEEYPEELIHNNGAIIFEGTGSLTVLNAQNTFVEVHAGNREDITIKDCTINCNAGKTGGNIFNGRNLTLDNCKLNIEYDAARKQELAGDSELVYLEGNLVMRNAEWNIKTTSIANDIGSQGVYMRIGNGNVEFHSSKLIISGEDFKGISVGLTTVIIDNSYLEGYKELLGSMNEGGTTSTTFQFLNKHQFLDHSGKKYLECSGTHTLYNPDDSWSTDAGQAFSYGYKLIPAKASSGGGGTNTKPGTQHENPVKVKKIVISGQKVVTEGTKTTLKVKISPANAANKNITWKSSDKKIATVSGKGVVTLKKGTANKTVVITAAARDGSKAAGKFVIRSRPAVKSIKLTASAKTLKAGKTMIIKAKVTAPKGALKKVKWSVSNKKYAKISQKGKLTALQAGKNKTVAVIATAKDGSKRKAKLKIKIK